MMGKIFGAIYESDKLRKSEFLIILSFFPLLINTSSTTKILKLSINVFKYLILNISYINKFFE